MATDAFENRWYKDGDESYVNTCHWTIAAHSDDPEIVKQAKADLAKHKAGLKHEDEKLVTKHRKAEQFEEERLQLIQTLTKKFDKWAESAENLLREHPDLVSHPELSPVLKNLGL